MSVIIEGVHKPKNCFFCPFNNDDCWCNLTKGNIDRDFGYCSVTCPIKELPEEHGDLKDELDLDLFAPSLGTDEYINDLMAKHNIDYVNGDDEDKVRAFAMDLIHGCMNVIKTAPTIIEADTAGSEE